MSVTYDFDIMDFAAPAPGEDLALRDFLLRAGMGGPPGAERVALFRDPRTAEALGRAPAGLRAWMLGAGFGLHSHDAGHPPDRYPAQDELARVALIERLAQTAPQFDLADGAGDFRLADFLAAVERATPMACPVAAQPQGKGDDAPFPPAPQPRPGLPRLPALGQRVWNSLPGLAALRRA